eukprot:2224320-Prymnesium_polylepis.1
MSSVPPRMDHPGTSPMASRKRAAARAGKSAASHVMVSEREVKALWLERAALSQQRTLRRPSSFSWRTAKPGRSGPCNATRPPRRRCGRLGRGSRGRSRGARRAPRWSAPTGGAAGRGRAACWKRRSRSRTT